MKKFFLLILSLYLIFFTYRTIIFANNNILSETVQIISYDLTKNNHMLGKSIASGTIISKDGLVLTNHHVVTDENDENYEGFAICVVVNKEKKPECLYTASFVASDKSYDIALLKINEKDVYLKDIPDFNYLKTDYNELPKNGEHIRVEGFPEIGGDTITLTEGKISGFETQENITLLKTDATVSMGNSGGTVRNQEGIFIGIPSFIKSYNGVIGYIVPLKEIQTWLQKNIVDEVFTDTFTDTLLKNHLKTLHITEKTRVYTSKIFPYYEIQIPEPWKVLFMNDTGLDIQNTVKGQSILLTLSIGISPYKITDAFMNFTLKTIEKNKHEVTNYKRVKKNIDSFIGYQINFDIYNNHKYIYIGYKDNIAFSYSYDLPSDNFEETSQAINDLLKTLKFKGGENNTEIYLQEYSQTHPDISIQTFDNFYIQSIYNNQEENTILDILNPYSFEQEFSITQNYMEKNLRNLGIEDILKEDLKNHKYMYNNYKLVNKYSDIIIDGLKGYGYSFSYQGDDFNKIRKQTTIVLLAGDKFFRFSYDDLINEYEKNIVTALKSIKTFTYNGEENIKDKGEYKLPTFQMFYQDIKEHMYEEEINSLASNNILNYKTKNFYPERTVTRLDAIKAIINSKLFIEQGRNLSETKDAIEKSSKKSKYTDYSKESDNKILNFVRKKGILSESNELNPKKSITASELLKMLCKTYELSVWDPSYLEDIPWYLPYLYKGQILEVLPENVKYDTKITRGQFAYILYKFTSTVGERSDL